MAAKKMTKKDLLYEIDGKIQSLSLLKSALQADRSRKSEMLDEYRTKFGALLSSKNKK
jgi:hypothetical protein